MKDAKRRMKTENLFSLKSAGFFLASFCLFAAILIVYSQVRKDDFDLAKDFPRGALIYLQINDLPKFIKNWNQSKLKENYLKSANFTEFANNHLGRKMASRWREFNAAAGFEIDSETVANFAENRAALAIYDVGKLEFVFVAPVSDEVFAATNFFGNKDKFEAETLADGTEIYRAAVEADRGRQKQELIFTHAKGRLIVATSAKLLGQTLDNINGKSAKNSLADEPDFKSLSAKITPHTAAVWLDQKALNEDYYFKRYWLMSAVEDLKNIRAGIFDFEIAEEKIIEKRKFLLEKPTENAPVNPRQAENLLSFLPENVPFYSLQKAGKGAVGQAVQKTCFYRKAVEEKKSYGKIYRDYEYDEYEDFASLSAHFDEKIDESDDIETIARAEINFDFAEIMQSANPQSVLTFDEPRVLPAPLFVEFDRAAVFHFASPQNFDRSAFEAEITRILSAKTMIAAPETKLKWETKTENNLSRREINLPLIGWKICYAIRGNEFVLSNNAEFLHKILITGETKKSEPETNSKNAFDKLTVIDLTQKENAFAQIFKEMADKNFDGHFFTGNIESLLDTASDIKKIEIRRRGSQNFLDEEIIFQIE